MTSGPSKHAIFSLSAAFFDSHNHTSRFSIDIQVAIHGYSAYGASKWALRGLAEALQMEVKPFGIYVSVSYPPDTDTPGLHFLLPRYVYSFLFVVLSQTLVQKVAWSQFHTSVYFEQYIVIYYTICTVFLFPCRIQRGDVVEASDHPRALGVRRCKFNLFFIMSCVD